MIKEKVTFIKGKKKLCRLKIEFVTFFSAKKTYFYFISLLIVKIVIKVFENPCGTKIEIGKEIKKAKTNTCRQNAFDQARAECFFCFSSGVSKFHCEIRKETKAKPQPHAGNIKKQ